MVHLPPPPPKSFAVQSAVDAVRSKPAARLDEYQQAVVDCGDKMIVGEAPAGAGKTTVAIAYAAARPSAKFLYLCFGKSNQVEAEARFGGLGNTECRTGHSLAYSAVGHRFAGQITHNWRGKDLAIQLNIADSRMGNILKDVLSVYMASADKDVGLAHIINGPADKWSLNPEEYESVLAMAKLAWSRMSQPGSGVQMPHDGYLKLWALSGPKLTKYTHIILDEGQDTNPVMSQLFERQTHATRLIIGDRNQSIFLFRGAVNAMERFSAFGATVLQMPRTWRFGPQIAGVANDILSFFKEEESKIIGAGPGSARRPERKRTVLSRTNAGLFGEAMAVRGLQTHWLGGLERYKIDRLTDAYYLKSDQRRSIRDPELRSYTSWSAYKDDADRNQDGEARMLIKLSEKYGKDLPFLVDSIKRNALTTETGAALVLATAHSAKGLDFDRVTISDDFQCLNKAFDELKLNPTARLSPAMEQEINLLYVAITRARHILELNKETVDFLKRLDLNAHELREIRARAVPAELESPRG